jgi:hypothetical protein
MFALHYQVLVYVCVTLSCFIFCLCYIIMFYFMFMVNYHVLFYVHVIFKANVDSVPFLSSTSMCAFGDETYFRQLYINEHVLCLFQ